MTTNDIIRLICDSKIKKFEEYIITINNILKDIENHKLDTKKFDKHDPFATDPKNIKSVEFKNDQIYIKYQNIDKTNTILFNYNDNNRGFSFVNDKNEHINLIKQELNNQISFLNLYIEIFNKIVNKINNNILLDNNEKYFVNNYNYYINDILKIKTHDNINNKEYYLSICPIFGFYLNNKRIYIANQYMLKFENNNFNLYYYYTDRYNFKILLSRPKLKEKILYFNKSGTKITTKNFMNIINNIRPMFIDHFIEIENKKYCIKLENIDKPPILIEYNN